MSKRTIKAGPTVEHYIGGERLVKVSSNQRNLAIMRSILRKALKEAKLAQKVASKTACCCEVSLDDLVSEIQTNIEVTEMHIKQGLLEMDLIKIIQK